MLTVSVKSWHYRLLDWTYGRVPHNLCPYVNKLILAIIGAPFVYTWRMLSENAKFIAFLEAVAFGYGMVISLQTKSLLYGIILGHVLTYGGLLMLIVLLRDIVPRHFSLHWPKWLTLHKAKKPKVEKVTVTPVKQPKEPSIVTEFIKAKHQRICPFIQFKDE